MTRKEELNSNNEFSKKDKDRENIVSLDLATSFRNEENKDLPIKSTIGNKTSDIIGNLKINPTKHLDFDYNFSLDNDLNRSNFDEVKTTLSINNFVTSFEFLEEDNLLNENSYLKNISKYKFSDNYSISFEASKNLDKNITDYYNLIYEYENDCLTVAIEYNKNYYSDGTLKPDENILFSIKIIPFGKINSPALAK